MAVKLLCTKLWFSVTINLRYRNELIV